MVVVAERHGSLPRQVLGSSSHFEEDSFGGGLARDEFREIFYYFS